MVELILVLLLLVAALGLTLPAVLSPLGQTELRHAAEQVRGALGQARIAAIESGMPHVFQFQPGGARWVIAPRLPTVSGLPPTNGDHLAAAASPANDSSSGRSGRADIAMVTVADELPYGVVFASPTTDEPEATPLEFSVAANLPAPADGFMSPPIIFYPNGRASDECIGLLGPRDLRLDVSLRGLTGTATISEPGSSAKAAPPVAAATAEKSVP